MCFLCVYLSQFMPRHNITLTTKEIGDKAKKVAKKSPYRTFSAWIENLINEEFKKSDTSNKA